jgi:hypothetical protein
MEVVGGGLFCRSDPPFFPFEIFSLFIVFDLLGIYGEVKLSDSFFSSPLLFVLLEIMSFFSCLTVYETP